MFSVRRLDGNENESGIAQDVTRSQYQRVGTGMSEVQRRKEESTQSPPASVSVRTRREVESNLELLDTIMLLVA